jgi:hypothetical protein
LKGREGKKGKGRIKCREGVGECREEERARRRERRGDKTKRDKGALTCVGRKSLLYTESTECVNI